MDPLKQMLNKYSKCIRVTGLFSFLFFTRCYSWWSGQGKRKCLATCFLFFVLCKCGIESRNTQITIATKQQGARSQELWGRRNHKPLATRFGLVSFKLRQRGMSHAVIFNYIASCKLVDSITLTTNQRSDYFNHRNSCQGVTFSMKRCFGLTRKFKNIQSNLFADVLSLILLNVILLLCLPRVVKVFFNCCKLRQLNIWTFLKEAI